MQKKINLILLIVLVAILFSCHKVPAGFVGIKVNLYGSQKGVDTEELKPGQYGHAAGIEYYNFPTFQQNYVWTKDPMEGSENDESFTFQTIEGLSVNADIGITYHLNSEKISNIFQKYRKGINEITDIFMRNYVRDAFNSIASKYPVESVYGNGKTELIENVQESISKELTLQGIIIDKLYWIGSIRLPDSVVNALNSKIEATQRAQQRENELREAEAEAKKKIAQSEGDAQAMLIKAKAEAESIKVKSNSITANLIQYEAIQKWDGKLPGVTSGNIPFINIK